MTNPLVSIILVVRNSEKYIRHCLGAVLGQVYQPIEIVIFDNNSEDNTVDIVKKNFPNIKLYKNPKNLFIGPAFNKAWKLGLCKGDFILLLCVDVILDKNFILEAVKTMQEDLTIGVVQAKTLKFDFNGDEIKKTNIIDTTGFEIFKSRRLINRGHGENDKGQYDKTGEIFSYEGAAGFFRKKALEEAEINNEIFDEDFEWMVDDFDLGWRLRLLGWKNYYNYKMVCCHDRQTTKRLSAGRLDFIRQRKQISSLKRKLDFRNMFLTLLKNDFFLLFLGDFWYILWREVQFCLYVLFFEWTTISAYSEILKLTPKMFKKRKEIMRKKKAGIKEIKKWFY